MSGDPNSFEDSEYQTSQYTDDYTREGPVLRDDTMSRTASTAC